MAVDTDPTISVTQFRRNDLSKNIKARESNLAVLRGLGLPR